MSISKKILREREMILLFVFAYKFFQIIKILFEHIGVLLKSFFNGTNRVFYNSFVGASDTFFVIQKTLFRSYVLYEFCYVLHHRIYMNGESLFITKRLKICRQCICIWHLSIFKKHWDDFYIFFKRCSYFLAYKIIFFKKS